jgi:uncharacterized membrane protein
MALWMWFVVLIPPALFAVSNLMDKVIVHGEGEDNSPGAIISMNAVLDIVFCLPLGFYILVVGKSIPLGMFLPLFLNGIVVTLAGYLFYRVIRVEEASRAVPIFQTIPLFGLLLGYYGLGENLGWKVLVAIFALMIGGYLLSVKKSKIKAGMVGLMVLSSLLYAVNDYILADYGRQANEISVVIFADLAGKMFFGMIFLLRRSDRTSFKLGLKTKFGLVAASSIVFGAGDIVYDVAKMYVPLAVVQAMCCTQPLFVLIGAVGLTLFCKGFPKEDIQGGAVWQKVVGGIMMMVGGVLLSI